MLKSVSLCQVAQSYLEGTLASVNFANPAKQVSIETPFIDHTKRQKINNLLDNGDISPHQYQSVFKAAQDFMVTVTKYLLMIDFTNRFNHNFESVKYFAKIFPSLNAIDKDKLQSQFLNYLTLAMRTKISQKLYSLLSPPVKLGIVQLMSFRVF